jgi:hypothetical protein
LRGAFFAARWADAQSRASRSSVGRNDRG